jgi:hypothetical protein
MGWVSLAFLASHFAMVGFPAGEGDEASTGAALMAFAEQCAPVQLKGDNYVCVLRDQSGGELRIGLKKQADGGMEIATFNPAFQGEGRTEVTANLNVSDPQWQPFEVTLQARFGEDDVPLIVDLADPTEAGRFTRGAKLSLDITAFADELTLHDSEAAYHAAQKDGEVKFAANHFIPAGMFAAENEANARPTAHALFAGKVLKSELRRNAIGKADYWWLLVETYGGAIVNVVADPGMVKTAPKIGGTVAGAFWMSGRLRKP